MQSFGFGELKKREFKKRLKKSVVPYMMLLPLLIGFSVFSLYPILWAVKFAWFDYDGVEATFVGFDNFIRAFTRDPGYWASVMNTLILSFGKLAVEIPLALVLAVLLNKKIRGKALFRSAYFMPTIVGVSVIGLIFYFMFASFEGIVNNMLMSIGLIDSPVNWFGEKWTAMLVLAIASIWHNFGVNMLFILSGLQNISEDVYESAEIDGANAIQKFFRITIPMLAPVLQVVLMLAIVGSIREADLILVLTNGQPAGETEVVMTYIFKYFFSLDGSIRQVGYASALGLITAVIIGILTVIYLKSTSKMQNVYDGD